MSSERLTVRRFVSADLDLLDRLNSDPVVMLHLGGAVGRTESEAMLEKRILPYYDEHPGLGIWVTQEKAGGGCIGFHLLNHIRGETFIQVGYRLLPEYWGQGYATEMSVALLRYGFVELGLPQIVAITAVNNFASQQVLLKSGLQRRGERSFAHPNYAPYGAMPWFERDAAGWLGERD